MTELFSLVLVNEYILVEKPPSRKKKRKRSLINTSDLSEEEEEQTFWNVFFEIRFEVEQNLFDSCNIQENIQSADRHK